MEAEESKIDLFTIDKGYIWKDSDVWSLKQYSKAVGPLWRYFYWTPVEKELDQKLCIPFYAVVARYTMVRLAKLVYPNVGSWLE